MYKPLAVIVMIIIVLSIMLSNWMEQSGIWKDEVKNTIKPGSNNESGEKPESKKKKRRNKTQIKADLKAKEEELEIKEKEILAPLLDKDLINESIEPTPKSDKSALKAMMSNYKFRFTGHNSAEIIINTSSRDFDPVHEEVILGYDGMSIVTSDNGIGLITSATLGGFTGKYTAPHVLLTHSSLCNKMVAVNPQVLCSHSVTDRLPRENYKTTEYQLVTMRIEDTKTVIITGQIYCKILASISINKKPKTLRSVAVVIKLPCSMRYVLSGSVIKLGLEVYVVSLGFREDEIGCYVMAFRAMNHPLVLDVKTDKW